MNNDLISRETLKKVIAEKATFIDGDSVYKIIDLIDNAPAVENITVFTESPDEKAIADLKEELQKIIAEKRPKSEWIMQRHDLDGCFYTCSNCGRVIVTFPNKLAEYYPFCHCGADMRKGGAE